MGSGVVHNLAQIAACSANRSRRRGETTEIRTPAGSYATNPASGEEVPVWVADYVLGSYGSGAIMAVPAHDSRDHEFATLYGLPIRQVVSGGGGDQELPFPGM